MVIIINDYDDNNNDFVDVEIIPQVCAKVFFIYELFIKNQNIWSIIYQSIWTITAMMNQNRNPFLRIIICAISPRKNLYTSKKLHTIFMSVLKRRKNERIWKKERKTWERGTVGPSFLAVSCVHSIKHWSWRLFGQCLITDSHSA